MTIPATFPPSLVLAAFLGGLHFLVDAASLTILYDEAARKRLAAGGLDAWIDLYNFLAFALQLPFGLAVDAWRGHGKTILLGLAGVSLALVLGPDYSFPAVVLVGLGNALFHVGAGGFILSQAPGRATEAGVFVAPGALGVAVGIHLGGRGFPAHAWLLAPLVVGTGTLAWWHFLAGRKIARETFLRQQEEPSPRIQGAWLFGGGLLLASVIVRSLVAGALTAPYSESEEFSFLFLPLAAAAGKVLGGWAADRAGWRFTAAAALLSLAVLLVDPVFLGGPQRWLGLFLVQCTMAVTLAGLALALPGYPGTAFGLTSLALLLGSFPERWQWLERFDSGDFLFLVLMSTLTVILGLSLLRTHKKR